MTLRYFGRTAQLLEILFILLTSQLPAYLGRGRQLSNLTKSSKFMRETEDTLFENGSKFKHIVRKWLKMSHLKVLNFGIFHQFQVISKLTYLLTLFDHKLQVSENSSNWSVFGNFYVLLSTQNINVARFARNVYWDFSFNFQTPCSNSFHFFVAFGKMDRLEGTILLMREDLLLGQAG